MGISPAIAFMLYIGEVQNASIIHSVALCYIFLRSLRG